MVVQLEHGGTGDMLTGGPGRDTFRFTAMEDRGDIITDFETGAMGDRLDLIDLMRSLGYAGTNGVSTGTVRGIQNGGDTIVEVDADPSAGHHWLSLATLHGVNAAAMTNDNSIFYAVG
jgi:hypothetical protein